MFTHQSHNENFPTPKPSSDLIRLPHVTFLLVWSMVREILTETSHYLCLPAEVLRILSCTKSTVILQSFGELNFRYLSSHDLSLSFFFQDAHAVVFYFYLFFNFFIFYSVVSVVLFSVRIDLSVNCGTAASLVRGSVDLRPTTTFVLPIGMIDQKGRHCMCSYDSRFSGQ